MMCVRDSVDVSLCHACHANEGGCKVAPRLPRKTTIDKPLSCQMVFSNLVGVFTLVYILKNLVPYTSYLCILHSHHTSSCLVMSNSTCHKSSPPALTFPTILHHIIILGLVFCMFLKEHQSQYYFVSTNHY